MTCNRCPCQCNGTPVQLQFWLSPVLSRNHFAAPPLIRARGVGAEPFCRSTLLLYCPCTAADWEKRQNSTQNLRECRTANLRRAGAVAEILLSSLALLGHAGAGTAVPQLPTPAHANTCACSGSCLTPAAGSNIAARPFKTPLGDVCSC